MSTAVFPALKFTGTLRPSQREVVDIARRKIEDGKRRLHIVAPPGAGKTVLGLYLWAECIRQPALVLSPNSAIQAQWAARTSLFAIDGDALPDSHVSTDANRAALLTSLTYQSVTLPERRSADTDLAATALWVERLVEQRHAETPEAANAWIDDLQRRNLDYFNQRLSGWRKQARDAAALQSPSLDGLHDASHATLQRLKDANVGVIILDECHHLMGHWGRVLAAADEFLGHPIIIGLTATPPDGENQKSEDVERYQQYFGPIDYEVPVPAVVRDGYLAPYQDLAWFVEPTEREREFVAETDESFHQLLDELCQPRHSVDGVPGLTEWLEQTLRSLELPGLRCESWKEFRRRDHAFADASRNFLVSKNRPLPNGIPDTTSRMTRWFRTSRSAVEPSLPELLTVVDRYVRHGLRRSSSPNDQQLCRKAVDQLRMLGWQITETGSRSCTSPITRVLGHTRSKARALVPILTSEMENLEDDLRAVVITDYEKASAVSADVQGILDENAGGAMSAFRELVNDPLTNTLDPILLTGSTILVDHDLADLFLAASDHWLVLNHFDVTLDLHDEGAFHVVNGSGSDWCPRVYIEMVTQLFQDGVTRCLVGTRALLGEGWDANRINVLIDLTTATTSMTVNQLRGRSIRLDPRCPDKVANNWDVVCVAPDFSRGMDDYERFCRKHETIFGVTDDGSIEKGAGHVHPSLTPDGPQIGTRPLADLNAEMLERAGNRSHLRQLWNIGKALSGSVTMAVEMKTSADEREGFRNAATFAQTIGSIVLETLEAVDKVERGGKLRIKSIDEDRVKLWLTGVSLPDCGQFAEAVSEVTSPFRRPRYIISQPINSQGPVKRWMPTAITEFFARPQEERTLYRAIPHSLSKNRALVDVFERLWQQKFRTSEAVSTRSVDGEKMLDDAIAQELMPKTESRVVECFL